MLLYIAYHFFFHIEKHSNDVLQVHFSIAGPGLWNGLLNIPR